MESYNGRPYSALGDMDESPRGNKRISPDGQRPFANGRKSDKSEDTLSGEAAAIGDVAQNYLAEANTACTKAGEWHQQTEADLLQSLEDLLNELYGEAQKQAEEDRNKARQEARRITREATELRQVAQQEMDEAKARRIQADEHLKRVRKEAEVTRENAHAELDKAQEYRLESEKGLEQVRAEARSIKEAAGREATRICTEARTQAREIVRHIRITQLEQESATRALKEAEEINQRALEEAQQMLAEAAQVQRGAKTEAEALLKTSREKATYLLTQEGEIKELAEQALEQARSAKAQATQYQEDLRGQLEQMRAALRDPNFLLKAREAIKKAHLVAPGDLDEKVNQARSFLDLAHLYNGKVEIEVSPISSTLELVRCQQQFRDLIPESQITEVRPDEGGRGVVLIVELGLAVPLVKILKDRLVNGAVEGVSNSRVKVTLSGQQPAVSFRPASA